MSDNISIMPDAAKHDRQPITVVKVGGAVVEDEAQLTQLLADFSAIEGRKVLVHGGGRRATGSLAARNREPDGRRTTHYGP